MALTPGSSKLFTMASDALSDATQWVKGMFGAQDFSPEEALESMPTLDPRLKPRVKMNADNIDVSLLAELGKAGYKRGKLITAESHPELYAKWTEMSHRAGLPKPPQLILTESKQINALTVSPQEVAISTGLLKIMDLREVSAVLAHELGHAVSDHTMPRVAATMTFGGLGVLAAHEVTTTNFFQRYVGRLPFVGIVAQLAAFGVGVLGGGAVANHISVKPTELQADLKGAAISGDPLGLASALAKLDSQQRKPLRTFLSYVRSGYPTMDERIANLREVAKQMPAPELGAPVTLPPAQAHHQPGVKVNHVVAAADRAGTLIAPGLSAS